MPEGIGRSYFDFQSRMTGPVFNRIWKTSKNGYAEKFKHVIEPTLMIQRTTAIDNFDRIVYLDGTDYIVGGVTRFNYAFTNRLYAKKQRRGRLSGPGLPELLHDAAPRSST